MACVRRFLHWRNFYVISPDLHDYEEKKQEEVVEMKEIQIQGIPAVIDRRPIKNINIYIKPPDGKVLITAPKRARERDIMDFLSSKSDWIVRNHWKMVNHASSRQTAEKEISKQERDILYQKILAFASKWEPVMGVKAKDFTIRDMKTLWGSCSTKTGRIRMNLQLIRYPDPCIEYVVVHELCHLLEPSHNQRFKDLMKTFLPDWEERKKRLNQG